MKKQKILNVDEGYNDLDQYFIGNKVRKIFLVCGKSISSLKIGQYFDSLEKRLGIKVVKFSNFKPNPVYESIVLGVELFRNEACDMIVAVGGGSAMDVAKCIKLYSNMKPEINYLKQEIVPNDIKFLAVPTTAGTGSEATRYAVIYYKGEKQSVTDESCIPSAVLIDASVLKTLSLYQKKVTMLDALCHAMESFWSVNSTDESKDYSRTAIKLIFENKNLYLENNETGNKNMLKAANIAGKAINITQTTAGHAMCYKLTSLYKLAHGHAAALCIEKLWPYMVQNTEKCIDDRGAQYLDTLFTEIALAMSCETVSQAIDVFSSLLQELDLEVPKVIDKNDFEILRKSVNLVRLKNNPIKLDEEIVDMLYHQILQIE